MGWRTLFRSDLLVATTAINTPSIIVLTGFRSLVPPVYFTMRERPELLCLVLNAWRWKRSTAAECMQPSTYAAQGGAGEIPLIDPSQDTGDLLASSMNT